MSLFSRVGSTPAQINTTAANTFGQTPAASTSGLSGSTLFGQTTTQAPASAGLLGQSAAAPAPAGGLFGAAAAAGAQPAAGGLFGGTTTTSAPAAGGLFGGATGTPAATGGLFGTTPATTAAAAPAGGLFGASTATAAQAPAATGGLFGGAATTPQPGATGGLFGGSTAGTSGGLFGGAAAAPKPSTGLFQQSTAQPAGGLFGASTTQPQAGFLGQTQPQGQQQAVEMNFNNLRGTTRYEELHSDVKGLLDFLERSVQDSIAISQELSARSIGQKEAMESVEADVEHVMRKLSSTNAFLNNDGHSIGQLQNAALHLNKTASVSTRTIDVLRLPPSQRSQYVSSHAKPDHSLMPYFEEKTAEIEGKTQNFLSAVTEVERTVEAIEREVGNAGGSAESKARDVAKAEKMVFSGLVAVAGRVAGLNEDLKSITDRTRI